MVSFVYSAGTYRYAIDQAARWDGMRSRKGVESMSNSYVRRKTPAGCQILAHALEAGADLSAPDTKI